MLHSWSHDHVGSLWRVRDVPRTQMHSEAHDSQPRKPPKPPSSFPLRMQYLGRGFGPAEFILSADFLSGNEVIGLMMMMMTSTH